MHNTYKEEFILLVMKDVFTFETTMKRKPAPSMSISWTRKPTKKKISPEFKQLLDKLWEERDGKKNT